MRVDQGNLVVRGLLVFLGAAASVGSPAGSLVVPDAGDRDRGKESIAAAREGLDEAGILR